MFLGAVFVLNHVRAADPDPLQDFCIADINASNSIPTNGYLCKARSLVTADDFTFTGLREKGKESDQRFSDREAAFHL